MKAFLFYIWKTESKFLVFRFIILSIIFVLAVVCDIALMIFDSEEIIPLINRIFSLFIIIITYNMYIKLYEGCRSFMNYIDITPVGIGKCRLLLEEICVVYDIYSFMLGSLLLVIAKCLENTYEIDYIFYLRVVGLYLICKIILCIIINCLDDVKFSSYIFIFIGYLFAVLGRKIDFSNNWDEFEIIIIVYSIIIILLLLLLKLNNINVREKLL